MCLLRTPESQLPLADRGTILQSYTLMSTDYAHPTRLECKRLLEEMGAAVSIQNANGMAILKCRVHERRGAFPGLESAKTLTSS